MLPAPPRKKKVQPNITNKHILTNKLSQALFDSKSTDPIFHDIPKLHLCNQQKYWYGNSRHDASRIAKRNEPYIRFPKIKGKWETGKVVHQENGRQVSYFPMVFPTRPQTRRGA